MAYRKINLAAGSNFVGGVFIIIMYIGWTLDTGNMELFLIPLFVGIWLIFTSFMLKKAERLILSGDLGKIRKGGEIAAIFGILGFNWWAFVGGTEAMDWKWVETEYI